MGGVPLHTYQDYLANTNISPVKEVSDDHVAVQTVLDNSSRLIDRLRDVISQANELNDEGTADMATAMLRELEKNTWMLAAYLKQTPLA
jgi:starvation-inducible DNA-binding protein